MKLPIKLVFISILILPAVFSFAIIKNVNNTSGKELFRNNCAACHKIGSDLIGPDLTGISSKRPNYWIHNFIKNSQKIILSGDDYATGLYKNYKQVIMPENLLTDNQIDSILNYINKVSTSVSIENIPWQQENFSKQKNTGYPEFHKKNIILLTLIILVFLFLIIPIILTSVYMHFESKNLNEYPAVKRYFLLLNIFLVTKVSKAFYVFNALLVLFLVIIFNYNVLTNPIFKIKPQVVYFSHAVHYDTFSINCIFCHDGADKGNFAGLPGIRNCMKCHDYITKGEKYGRQELLKLTLIYKTGKDIHWATGYRYNDYVHFNHALHYEAGKISCRKCHENPGDVEIKKAAFSMRWCIDCHKKSDINKFGKYFKKTSDSIQLLKITKVSESGGIDCGKCHY